MNTNRDSNHKYGEKNQLLGVFDKKMLEDLLEKMSHSLGASFLVIDYRGQVVARRLMNQEYCEKRKTRYTGCAECEITSAFAAAKAAVKGEPALFCCPGGLMKMALPIAVNHQYVGAVIGGPVRSEDSAECSSSPEKKEEEATPDALALCEKIPRLSSEKLKAFSEIFYLLLREMGEPKLAGEQLATMKRQETHLKEMRRSNQFLKQRLEEMEQNNLKAKLLPQFLMNLFSVISNFSVLENASKTEQVISELASVFRYYVDDARELIPVRKELEQVNRYLSVLKAQYEGQMDYRIKCESGAAAKKIPALSLFPFVCYVINGGLLSSHAKRKFYITGEMEKNETGHREAGEERIVYIIQKNGGDEAGAAREEEKYSPFYKNDDFFLEQMENAKKRLQFLFGEDCEVEISPGFVKIKLPGEKRAEKEAAYD